MESSVVLEVFSVEEAAALLYMKPDTIRKAVLSGDLAAGSEHQITGPALSRCWKARGGDKVFLDDLLDSTPWLPAIFVRATEAFHSRTIAREWLLKSQRALGGKTPLDAAGTEEGAEEVLNILARIEDGAPS